LEVKMLIAILLALAGPAVPPPPISDAQLAALDAHPFDHGQLMFHHDVLGLNHGMRVIADYPCSDVCPAATTRIIHYDRAPGPGCEAAGGATVTRMVPRSIAVVRQDFCVPRILARRR
jgi:hypothetical protein